MSIRIVTDSTADLPPEAVAEHGIEVVPLTVFFGDEALLDGVDIDADRFYARLQTDSRLPTTSQPSPGAFREVYQRLADEGATEILSIHLSARLSGTLEAAIQGAAGLDVPVEHVDSQFVSLSLGLGVIAAARAVERGAPLDETRALAEDQFRRTHCFFLLDTLEYLRRGGRVGRAAGVVGTLLRVKPVLTLEAGEVVPFARARTRLKAIEEALSRVAELRPIEQAMVVHSTVPDDLDYVVTRLRGLAPDASIVTGRLGPTVGVHGGPGTLGLAVVSSPQPPG